MSRTFRKTLFKTVGRNKTKIEITVAEKDCNYNYKRINEKNKIIKKIKLKEMKDIIAE